MKNIYLFLILYIVCVFVVSLPTRLTMFDTLLKDINGTCPELLSTPLFNASIPYFEVCDYFPEDNLNMASLQKYLCVNIIDADYQLCKKKSKNKIDIPKNYNDLQKIIDESKLTVEEFCKDIKDYPLTEYEITKLYLKEINKDYSIHNKCLKMCDDIETKINPLCVIIHIIQQEIAKLNTYTTQEKILNKTNTPVTQDSTKSLQKTEKIHDEKKKIQLASTNNEEKVLMNRLEEKKENILNSMKSPGLVKSESNLIKDEPNEIKHELNEIKSVPNQTILKLNSTKQVSNSVSHVSSPTDHESKPTSNGESKPPSNDESKPPSNGEAKPPSNDESKPPSNDESKPPSNDESNLPSNNESILPSNNESIMKNVKSTPSEKISNKLGTKPTINNIKTQPSEITTKKPKSITNENDMYYATTNNDLEPGVGEDNGPEEEEEEEYSISKNIPSKPINNVISVPNTNIEYEETEESNFITYFMFTSVVFICCYIAYHNKQKILALVLEGRRERNGRRRPNTAGYRKLNCTLEEAVTSKSGGLATNVIY